MKCTNECTYTRIDIIGEGGLSHVNIVTQTLHTHTHTQPLPLICEIGDVTDEIGPIEL